MDTRWLICCDTGGTFTDCIARSPDGEVYCAKVLSNSALRSTISKINKNSIEINPDWNFPLGFFSRFKLRNLQRGGVAHVSWSMPGSLGVGKFPADWMPGDLVELQSPEEAPVFAARICMQIPTNWSLPPLDMRLGTTRGTNALLEGTGDKVAFFVTKGFRDLLQIKDQRRPDLFALNVQKEPALHRVVVEVDERMAADGSVLKAPDLEALAVAARKARRSHCTVAAVALLHSYRNPVHEQQVGKVLAEAGFKHVSLSTDIMPLIKLVPRAETAVVDATLGPIMKSYLSSVHNALSGGSLKVMNSAGGLVDRRRYQPSQGLLSGPAGGVVGSIAKGLAAGERRLIGFDMGGTSTDVSRYDGALPYREHHRVGSAKVMSPALSIETVAAGGGSICGFRHGAFHVGPESAGSKPGPACYGAGGPLTLTDVNLLLGRLDARRFGIPIKKDHARRALNGVMKEAGTAAKPEAVLQGFLDIANERMAAAVRAISTREGHDPADYAMVSFGGAGGMHACSVAELLGISKIIVPRGAGLLSALGIQAALLEEIEVEQLLLPLDEVLRNLRTRISKCSRRALARLQRDAQAKGKCGVRERTLAIRFQGQESVLWVDAEDAGQVEARFQEAYKQVFGYYPAGKQLEAVSLRVIVSTHPEEADQVDFQPKNTLGLQKQKPGWFAGGYVDTQIIDRDHLEPGMFGQGPAVILDPFSSLIIEPGWRFICGSDQTLKLERISETQEKRGAPEEVQRELFRQRFRAIVEEMGVQLERTAVSTNIRERLDFSCALLDARGKLVANAPHIPVHLGALGICVRKVVEQLEPREGDVFVTNHPAFGGSHLPDVTVITPVFHESALVGYVVNRAHHAEIGGKRPGSMPADALCLADEGVVIPPIRLFEQGVEKEERIGQLLREARYPSRNIQDNLADLRAQVAANRRGAKAFQALISNHGASEVASRMEQLGEQTAQLLSAALAEVKLHGAHAVEHMDDGTPIEVRLAMRGGRLSVDFTGTGSVQPGNLNAPIGIVASALLYVLRLLVREDIPLNEGLLDRVDWIVPENCFINPTFPDDPEKCPAVVGGNVETSQRIVDVLLKALGLAACSQGTMNNFLFGASGFGYYETIGGGTGAGDGFAGASAVHSHMTNTAITDPEILEARYPVRLHEFGIRKGSGGKGQWPGGDGMIREIEFLEPLELSLLTQHRKEAPFGLAGGGNGKPGKQCLIQPDGTRKALPGICSIEVPPGSRIRIETPGGGAWGTA